MNVSDMMYANCRARNLRKKDPNVADENFMFLASTLGGKWPGYWRSTDEKVNFIPNPQSDIRVEEGYGEWVVKATSNASLSMTHEHSGPTNELYIRCIFQMPTHMAGVWNITPYDIFSVASDSGNLVKLSARRENLNSPNPSKWIFDAEWVSPSGQRKSVSLSINAEYQSGGDNYMNNRRAIYDVKLFIPKSEPGRLLVTKHETRVSVGVSETPIEGGTFGFNDSSGALTVVLNSSTPGKGTNQRISFNRFGIGNKITTAQP